MRKIELIIVIVFILLEFSCVQEKSLRPENLESSTSINIEEGDIKITFVNNDAFGESHLAGYNGIAELYHSAQDSTLFEPKYAGFNLEHIYGGDSLAEFFEPRTNPMELFNNDNNEVSLYQAPTPFSQFEMITTFKVVAPHYIDITFSCMVHSEDFFEHGYAGLFFASYILAPSDKHIYFKGFENEENTAKWISAYSEIHGEQSTHIGMNDDIDNYYFAPNFNARLACNFSNYKYELPVYYGRFHNMVSAFMFDTPEVIRFSQSPTGGGPANPAWDFQFIMPNLKQKKEYSFRARIVYKPFVDNEDILTEYKQWKRDLK